MPRLRGYLWKEGHQRKNWKKRWFLLDEGHLRYYEKKSSLEPIASITVTGAEVVSVQRPRRRHAFRLNTSPQEDGHSKYILAGETEKDSLEWIKALLDEGCKGNMMAITLLPRAGLVGSAKRRQFGKRLSAVFLSSSDLLDTSQPEENVEFEVCPCPDAVDHRSSPRRGRDAAP